MRAAKTAWRCAIFLAVWSVFSHFSFASEYIRQESPHPESAGKLEGPIEHAFGEKPLSERSLLQGLKATLDDKPAFWRDSKFGLDFRTFYFDRRNSGKDKREAWTAGGQFAYESGWWNDFSIRAAYYNSTELDAPSDSGDTGLLALGQENISVLGEASLRYRFTDTFLDGSILQLYRQTLGLPYVNKHDIRMLPATHEGYIIQRDNSSLDYVVGHLTKFKNFDSEDFVHMSEAVGAEGTDKGLSIAGARIPFTEEFTVGTVNYYGWDTFNTFFTEATYHAALDDDLDFRLSSQFTNQRSVGDDLVGDFDTNHMAARVAFGWRGAIVKVAGSITDDEAGIKAPWGGKPTYLSIQRLDFDRANEKAVLLGLSYNTDFFSSLGLSSYINIAHGTDAEDPSTGLDLPDRTEYDITVDYKPPEGVFEGLWIRARYAHLDIEGDGEEVRDFRIIVNYSIQFL